MRHLRVAVVGLPNVGKTSTINSITGSKLKTGNFSGTTVGKHEVSMPYSKAIITFIDLPGIYSLDKGENGVSKDECVAIDFLNNAEYDKILFISSSSDGGDGGLLFDITDLAKKRNIELIKIQNIISKKQNLTSETAKLKYNAIDKKSCRAILNVILGESSDTLYTENISKKISKEPFNTQKIDAILMHKIFGIPIFFSIMILCFYLSFNVGGLIGDFIASIFDYIANFSQSILIKGLCSGVGSVLSFVPSIIIVFIFLSFFEESGYITRICYLLNGILGRFGLGGRAFIPMFAGFGCSVHAYMASRIIKNNNERFLTMMAISFVPCSAKFSVFTMFCYAIFGPKLGGLVLFGIYVFGFVFGLVVAKVISFFYNRKNDNFYSGEDMFEIYDYRIPKVSRILTFAFAKVKDYFKNAATLILFSSFIFSILLSVNTSFGQASTASESIIARLASFVMPVFERIGFSWEMTVSVFSGLVAKEVSISTLAVLYGVSGSGVSISSVISSSISFASGVSMICFMFFYLPCVSATSVFYKELKDFSKVLILFLISFSLAFGSSFLAYYLLK